MPATATTFPSGPSVSLPRKKPSGGAGPANSAKSFFERTFNVKRFLKTTQVKSVFEWYDRVEDPVGELKKEIKKRIAERALFSMVGPKFRGSKFRNVSNLITNAPKEVFNWTYYGLWGGGWWYKNWGYEKHVQPVVKAETVNKFLAGDLKQVPYERNLLGVPKSYEAVLPKGGRFAGGWRLAGKVLGHVKWGLLATIPFGPLGLPIASLASLFLSEDSLASLGWETQQGYFRGKNGQPLLDRQGNIVRSRNIVTEDGREWTLRVSPMRPGDPLAKARVFTGTGRSARLMNGVSNASRYAYSLRHFFSRDTRFFDQQGWTRFGSYPKYTASGSYAGFNRALFYLHPKNWLLGTETWKRLGWSQQELLGLRGGKMLTVYRRASGRLARLSRIFYYLNPRNLLNGETFRLLGWNERYSVFRGEGFDINGWVSHRSSSQLIPRYSNNRLMNGFHRFSRFAYNFSPGVLLERLRGWFGDRRAGLANNARLLRSLGIRSYLSLKGVDFNNWVSQSKNPLARGLLRLRRSGLGKAAGGLRNGLGLAGGAAKKWLLAAKKKSDEVWKKLIAIPLKFLLDLIIKLLKDVALWVAEKVGPYLSRFGGFLSKLVPQGVKELFAKFGAKIGESLVGELLSKIGAQLAGKALLGVSLRFIGNVIVKGAFEAFAWVTAPEIQILSYAWRGAQFLFSKLLWQPAKWLVQQGATRLLTSLGERLLGQGVQATWRAVFGQLGSRLGGFLLEYAWRPLVGWLSGSVWPAVTGFITTTLPAWAAAAGEVIGAALSALMASIAGMVALSMLIIAGILVLVGIFYKITEFISNPTAKDVGRAPVVLSLKVAVDPKDTNGGGTNRIPNLDGKDHLVEFFLKARNDAEKKALNLQLLVGAPLNKSLSLDELGPATEKEFDKFGTMVNAGSARTETYLVTGTVVIDGKTYDLSTVGTLTIGASVTGRPCGWPATGALLSRFSDPWHSCMSGEQTCSGDLVRAFSDEDVTGQVVLSPLQSEGVVSNLYFGDDGGILNVKSLDDHFEIGLIHLARSSVELEPLTGLTHFGLKIGSHVTHGQQVAETYIGEIGRSHTTNLFYQVKLDGDNKDPETYAPAPTRGTFFPYEVTRGTTCP